MKHGDKKKAKASKASGKKASKSDKSKGVKGAKAESGPAKSSTKTSPKASAQSGTPSRGRGAPDGGFTNAAVGAAFKYAVKKYPNAFRKLTD